jgi:hypothetical protein
MPKEVEMKFRTGDLVVVRSKEEILATLDERGRFQGLPFMPQMFGYCGQRFTVYKRAHKTCDTVNDYRGRRLLDAVHLETRCDGESHGGCQAACLLFWKEAWLKPGLSEAAAHGPAEGESGVPCCTEDDVGRLTVRQTAGGEPRYVCQATTLPEFTAPLPWWDARQYLEDYCSGNVALGRMLAGFCYGGFFVVYRRLTRVWWRFGKLLSAFYDIVQVVAGGVQFPRKEGTIPAGQPTPTRELNLQSGDLVRVKPYREILATLNVHNKNRGLAFDAEMVPYCGGIYRVRTRLNKFIEEQTGRLIEARQPAVILEGVWCRSRYSDCRLFCPRSIYSWWREVWLERVSERACEGREP